MRALTFNLQLLEPMLVTTRQGDPNSAVSFDYAPGSVIRGALISLYLRKQKRKELDAHDQQVRDLFFNGRTRYLNAYPLAVIDNTGAMSRTSPTPLSWRIHKDDPGPVMRPEGSKVYD